MKKNPSPTSKKLSEDLPLLLLEWYDKKRRVLPWREDPTPYHVWVSEIMLQQTRVDTVLPYYERFMKEYPDIAALASAPEERLLKLWEGLGYYSRVRNLQKAAIQVMELQDGKIPSDPALLVKLSGIGAYTAAAIASIAFRVPAVALDGNLMRVYARLSSFDGDIRTPAAKKEAEQAYKELLPKDRPGDMNQALMDLGALICLPNGAPLCESCPLLKLCAAHREGLESAIPIPPVKKSRPIRHCTILLVRNGDRILLHKRPNNGLLAGLFEFPNADGTLTEKEALSLVSSYGFTAKTIRSLPRARHVFTHLVWEMTGYEILTEPSLESGDRISSGTSLESGDQFCLISIEKLKTETALPSAFSAYARLL